MGLKETIFMALLCLWVGGWVLYGVIASLIDLLKWIWRKIKWIY